MSRKEQHIGKQAQDLAEAALRSRGANFTQQIPTPYRVIGDGRKNRMIFAEKAIGDIIGSVPVQVGAATFPIPLMAEVKYSDGDRLQFSRLRPHQVEALNMLAALGWLALLVWVCPFGVFVMRWPVEGFEHGKALSLEAARAHDVQDLQNCPLTSD
jgi:hypothetical protein